MRQVDCRRQILYYYPVLEGKYREEVTKALIIIVTYAFATLGA